MHAIALVGIGIVLPLALGGRRWWWVAATTTAAVAFLVPRGPGSAALVVPFLVAAVVALAGWLRTAGRPATWGLAPAAGGLAGVYAVVAAVALAQSRAGLRLFGLGEPIVELTAIHYMFAGTAALTLAARTLDGHVPARAAVCLTGLAPPLVAVGFVTGAAGPQVGGAVLLSLGVCTTATLELRRAAAPPRRLPTSALLAVSGLAVWVPMVLAVAWAAGQHWAVPALSIPAMVRTHGVVNAFAFVLCGLLVTGPGGGAYAAPAGRA